MELTRRNFLKGALAGGAMAGASAALASCAPQGSGEAASESSASAMTAESYADMKWSFEIAPDPVSEDEIVETITHDIVIVGAGMAGLCT
ncbi:twin-arginine translocation signal domain-containing protein, partial [Slackia piriformis]